MRIRSIRPEFFKHDILATLEPLTRILFVGLWCMADVAGRLEDRPKRIKAEVLPYDDCDVAAMLEQLSASGFIVRYAVDGLHVIQIPAFRKHQRISGKESGTTSDYPEQPVKQPGSNGEAPGCPVLGREGKGERGNNSPSLSPPPDDLGEPTEDEFLTFTRTLGVPDSFARNKYHGKLQNGFGKRWKPFANQVEIWYRESLHKFPQPVLVPKKDLPIHTETAIDRQVRELREGKQ